MALATSVASARVGRDEETIESSIWVAVIEGRARRPAIRSSCFWTIGTSSIGSSMPRSPRATITVSAARMISSASSTACGFSILAISGSRVWRRTVSHVLGAAHERQRDHVDADRLAEAQHVEVLLGHGGQAAGVARDVEALARGDRAADLDQRSRPRTSPSRTCLDAQADGAVGEVDDVVGIDRARPGRPTTPTSARRRRGRSVPQTSTSRSPGLSSTRSSSSAPMRSLGPGRSWRIATGRPTAADGGAHALGVLGVHLAVAVGEVQPGDVEPGRDHPRERLRVAGGGADGGDDLRAAHCRPTYWTAWERLVNSR